MKAIKMGIQKNSRPLVLLLATVVVILTSMVVANATQTITTPNAAFVSYSLAPGTTSAAITPASNKSVLVIGCCTTAGSQGVGHVSLLHTPGGGMTWVGSAYVTGATRGSSATAGDSIVYIDAGAVVDIKVASADTISVRNISLSTMAGNVTLIW